MCVSSLPMNNEYFKHIRMPSLPGLRSGTIDWKKTHPHAKETLNVQVGVLYINIYSRSVDYVTALPFVLLLEIPIR